MLTQQSHIATQLKATVYETNARGLNMELVEDVFPEVNESSVRVFPDKRYQTITGIGGSFTQSSAHVLSQLSEENRMSVIKAYFGPDGSGYSLTRTHINSCDFSLGNYSYAPVADDRDLKHFSIAPDLDGIIPLIREAQSVSQDGFRVIASPWTAPPWMKDNNSWVGGRLLRGYYETWAMYFVKYLKSYHNEEIDIWGVTVENEPHGNGNNWESMLFSPREMTVFVRDYLGPTLEMHDLGHVRILGFDQNRANLDEWVDEMYRDEANAKYYSGTAVHWYSSTYEVFADQLQYAHQKAPNKHLIQTEGCIDSEPPVWKNDSWYWNEEATDWGWDWAPDEEKYLHPKYAPVNRYAIDIIGCLNNWVDGWIDWNIVLDRQGGPNWSNNWCTAPVIADPEKNEVYFTPLFYVMRHFSRFIRPGAKRVGIESTDKSLHITAALNPDSTLAVVIFNPTTDKKHFSLCIGDRFKNIAINPQALQTIEVQPNQPKHYE